ncbi:MAG: MFS transporter [Myxococcota bacterium]|nr:MFS transporter [Myxococcota bacterium]
MAAPVRDPDVASPDGFDRSSAATKLVYGSGATPFGIKDTAFNYFLLIYYNQVLGLDPFLAGLALAIAVVLDAISDVAVGYVSDHWRSRWGRRHPFMYAATVPVALSFYLLWNPPSAVVGGEGALFSYLLVMAILVRSFLTLFEVPNSAMGPELTKDYDDRTRLMAFRYVFGWLGGLSMAVLTYMVLLPSDGAGQLGARGYQLLGMVGSGSMLVMMLFSALGTHRHVPDFYQPTAGADPHLRSVLGEVAEMFRNRSFVSVFVSALLFGAAAGLGQAMSIYVATFFWSLESAEIGLIPMLGLVAVPISFVMAPRLAERWGKKEATMRFFLFAIAFLPIAFIAKLAGVFPDRDSVLYLPVLMSNYLIETTAIISMQIVFASMNADVVEDRSAETSGRRDEGLIFAARNFSKKAVSGLGVLLAGAILWVAGFPDQAEPGDVAPGAVTALIAIYLPVLLALYLASWRALRTYDIDRAKHMSNLRQQAV